MTADPHALETLLAQCIDLVESGDPAAAEDLLRGNPDHAARARRALASLVGLGIVDESSTDATAQRPLMIGRYHLVREIARGGQGIVYLAEDTRLQRSVALKVLQGLDDPEMVARFQREAAVASKLQHPGICTVFEASIERDVPFLAMEYLDGETLAAHIHASRERGDTELRVDPPSDGAMRQEPRTRADSGRERQGSQRRRQHILDVLAIVEKVARALHVAHEAGVIHRDVKPSNIILTPSRGPVLTDFGLARDDQSEHPTLTRTGAIFGTPEYMAPEQIDRAAPRPDRRTDVWALGVTLFECLTLARPFESPTRHGLYQAILGSAPSDPRSLNPAVPRDLSVVLERALEKDLDRRYRTADDLADELRRVRSFEPIHARPAGATLKLRRWAQRHPGTAASLAAAFVSLLAGLIVSTALLQRTTAALVDRDAALERYEQMSDASLVEQLEAEVDTLWPRRASMVGRMEDWIARAEALLERAPIHRAALAELRDRAAPWTPDEQRADARTRQARDPELYRQLTGLRARAARADGAEREQLAATIREMERDPRYTERLTFTLATREDTWRHAVMTDLVARLDPLAERVAEVRQRRHFALRVERETVVEHAARWDACRASIAADPRYGGLELQPQVGLVPLGRDADSGLWEFWHLGSGAEPGWEGERTSGEAAVADDSGLVLVLVPAGTYTMGAGERDAPHATPFESPARQVDVPAFFIGKHEVTQSQWRRVMGSNPSYHRPGGRPPGQAAATTWRNPVEHVDWPECVAALARLELVLPTERQWEYAARAGTVTPWWTGATIGELQGAANIGDATAGRVANWETTAEIDDGFVAHAPVGSFAPNPFGLHDTIGNVWEWCDDFYLRYDAEPPNDPDDPALAWWGPSGSTFLMRSQRGGAFDLPAYRGRSAARWGSPQLTKAHNAGVRAARAILDSPSEAPERPDAGDDR